MLRRLDCVLECAKDKVLDVAKRLSAKVENIDPVLRQATGGEQFYNTSPLTMTRLLHDPFNIADNLHAYVRAFSLGAGGRTAVCWSVAFWAAARWQRHGVRDHGGFGDIAQGKGASSQVVLPAVIPTAASGSNICTAACVIATFSRCWRGYVLAKPGSSSTPP